MCNQLSKLEWSIHLWFISLFRNAITFHLLQQMLHAGPSHPCLHLPFTGIQPFESEEKRFSKSAWWYSPENRIHTPQCTLYNWIIIRKLLFENYYSKTRVLTLAPYTNPNIMSAYSVSMMNPGSKRDKHLDAPKDSATTWSCIAISTLFTEDLQYN